MSLSSFLAWFGSCKSNQSITSVPAAEFRSEIQSHDTQLVDVRTPEEFDESHISGAVNIDVKSADFLPLAMKSLSKERPVYVYCRSGRRSLQAGEMLAKEGYRVVNLSGGIIEWTENNLPVESGNITK